ncbi:hypothetical protein JCM30471_25710 [Desulfuromonas carbonis]|uniref:hypothetical protein n=1 Tax=Desulfuromonas sp. DDH964 TaxID=1823759 RepID=UPI00078C5D35|nr:hypothetical protein [Desulfuromonas sp. DDH964]AMV70577.1 hypothetical protein DBW_0177 [Desulfuromonas sp. DDH964]
MTRHDEDQIYREFHDFETTGPITPGPALDEAVSARIGREMRRQTWQTGLKMTLAQIATGLATLTVCPQFGLGLGGHLSLHAGHAGAPALFFYLFCGLLFVSCGGILCGLLLRRTELAWARRFSTTFFLGYAAIAYFMLVMLGSEAFVVASLAWIPGAALGNLAGFALTRTLRQRLA